MEFLARREHSVHELRQKLLKKFSDATESVVNVVLDQLEKDNLQSDTRFAESYSRYRKIKALDAYTSGANSPHGGLNAILLKGM